MCLIEDVRGEELKFEVHSKVCDIQWCEHLSFYRLKQRYTECACAKVSNADEYVLYPVPFHWNYKKLVAILQVEKCQSHCNILWLHSYVFTK